jgi:prepilin-type N-terminal cleavage/methylation domain-containing protein
MTPNRTRPADEAGFTLAELMITVGIIGILIGIMIPSLLDTRRPAQDRQAQNLLRNSLTAAKAVETASETSPSQGQLAVEELGVNFLDAATNAPAGQRSVSVATGGFGANWYLIMVSGSSSGRCFALLEQPLMQPRFQRVDNATTCRADQFDTVTGWQDEWP